MSKWTLGVSIGVAALLTSLGVLAADIPADKAVITLDQIPGKQGSVKFPHAKHATEFKVDGQSIPCKTCHHTMKSDAETPQSCESCHVKTGETQKQFEGKTAPVLGVSGNMKSVIYHQNCLNSCHKKAKAADGKSIATCKTCHVKE